MFPEPGSISGRWGTQHASIVPYQTFATSDGYVTVGCGNDKQFAELCQLVGRPHWASDRRYASNESRVANREELVSVMKPIIINIETLGYRYFGCLGTIRHHG